MSFVLSYNIQNFQRLSLKCDVITPPWYLGHCSAKSKDIGLKLCTPVVGFGRFRFFGHLRNFGLCRLYLKKTEILIFGGRKPKTSKIRDSHSVEHVIWHLLVFVGCALLENPHSRSIWMLTVSRLKIAWHDVIKPPLFSIFSRQIALKFCLRMTNWRWIRYRQFRVDIFPGFYAIEKVR